MIVIHYCEVCKRVLTDNDGQYYTEDGTRLCYWCWCNLYSTKKAGEA